MNERTFVDTNVWVYAVDEADPAKQRQALEVVRSGQGHEMIVSSQVLSEFYAVVTRKLARPLSEDDAAAMVNELADLHVVSVDAALVARAVSASREWRISLGDGLIVRAAEAAGCKTLLSEDLASDRSYGSVTVRNPFA
jgi:predicted nucleic acid-binding protein